MGRPQGSLGLACICLLFGASAVAGGEPLRMRVSPAVAMAPGFLRIQLNVESAAENRLLRVVAESPDYYRRSEVSLDGEHAARLNVFEFRDLPTGLYHVTGTLAGVHGPRASVACLAKVEPSPGR